MGGGSTLALVRQNIVEALYLDAGLENGLVYVWNRLWNGLVSRASHIFWREEGKIHLSTMTCLERMQLLH